jgi:hypothetical protein
MARDLTRALTTHRNRPRRQRRDEVSTKAQRVIATLRADFRLRRSFRTDALSAQIPRANSPGPPNRSPQQAERSRPADTLAPRKSGFPRTEEFTVIRASGVRQRGRPPTISAIRTNVNPTTVNPTRATTKVSMEELSFLFRPDPALPSGQCVRPLASAT